METLLEQQRRYHEERERLMDSMTKESLYAAKPVTQNKLIRCINNLGPRTSVKGNVSKELNMLNVKDRVSQMALNHVHKHFYNQCPAYLNEHFTKVSAKTECTTELKDLYEDKDGFRKEEVQAIYGPNKFQEFYSRLKQLKDFHRKHPNEVSVPMSIEFDEINKMRETADENTNMVEFSDEEGYGKYLDLHDCHTMFINLKGMDKINYITYLSTFYHLFDIPKDRKSAAYKEYLQYLLEYLESYCLRIKPLLDIPKCGKRSSLLKKLRDGSQTPRKSSKTLLEMWSTKRHLRT